MYLSRVQISTISTVAALTLVGSGCNVSNEVLLGYKWPLILAVIVMILSLMFKRQVSGLLNRTTRIDKTGLSADPVPTSQQETREPSREVVETLIAEIGNSPALETKERSIRGSLAGKGITIEDGSVEAMLIRHLALTQTILDFERIYHVIWGSQITFLRTVNSAGTIGVDYEFLNTHFETLKETFSGPTCQ